jgi:hypothetical protein
MAGPPRLITPGKPGDFRSENFEAVLEKHAQQQAPTPGKTTNSAQRLVVPRGGPAAIASGWHTESESPQSPPDCARAHACGRTCRW